MTLDDFITKYIHNSSGPNATDIEGDNGKTINFYGDDGFAHDEGYSVWNDLPAGFKLAYGWCDTPYRQLWINFELRTIITYCEGDVIINQAKNDAIFLAMRVRCRNFYNKPRNLDRDYHKRGIHIDPEGWILATLPKGAIL